jgi:hypothetical protein
VGRVTGRVHDGMSEQTGTDNAPDPDSDEFLAEQNTVERVSPDTTADTPATDPDLVDTDPGGGTAENPAEGR